MGEAVLIAAFSGRALAQSARRAGYQPLVVDAFGDLDMREVASDYRIIAGAMERGFRTKPLIGALDELARSASSPPIGLVLGSGFEDKPSLVAMLAGRYPLIGSDVATYRASKDPASFFALLDKLAVAHPETQKTAPVDPEGWISKRIGGSGGRHIRSCRGAQKARPRRYFQRLIKGERLSVGALFVKRGRLVEGKDLALTRQWITPSSEHPFRFGGCVSEPEIGQALRDNLIETSARVGKAFGLVGMASFDFIVAKGRANLLEVNPRPGASLDVLDDDRGTLFAAHVAASTAAEPVPRAGPRSPARAAAILHADRGSLRLGAIEWPEWSGDRGAPGSFVPYGAPLATAFGEAPTADEAERLARARMAKLEDLIYGHATI